MFGSVSGLEMTVGRDETNGEVNEDQRLMESHGEPTLRLLFRCVIRR